ncbi:hypothetical protein EXN66_Car018287 [Channa argus]|uniref:Uncharacterized protein n=1 Tax=Channa argus TaxID=215402 RepID=A0A6G1QJN7_CHAAH|nr:hypothetical protein EXN66_Car018287 [Channa argus]
MDRITEEDNGLQTQRELASPPSLKRLRTHCTLTDNHSGESRFDFSELWTFWNSSPKSNPQNYVFLRTVAHKNNQGEKPKEETQDTKLIVTPITKTTTYTNNANTGLSKMCFIAAGKHLVHLGEEHPPTVNKSDKLFSYPLDDAGGALAESQTLKDAVPDMSSRPDSKRLLNSHECKANGGCFFPAGNKKNWRQVQDFISQIQVFTLSSSGKKVICQSDCTNENGFCTCQTAEVKVSNQKKDSNGFTKKEEEGSSPKSSMDYADFESYISYAYPFRNFAGDAKNVKKILELEIRENENVAICDGETKGQVNENNMSKYSIFPVAECVEESVVSYDVVLVRSNETENVCVETDDLCGVKGEHAAGKMIANVRNETANYATGTHISAKISQDPAEGENNPGVFSVIEPAIWSETDSEAKEKCCNSKRTPGVELSLSIKACETENPLSLCFDVRPLDELSAPNQTRQFNHQSTTKQCKSEKEDLCQSYTEPQVCSITTNELDNITGNQGNIPRSSAKPLSAGHARQESHETVGHQLEKQEQSHCFPVRLDNLTKQDAEWSETEIARMDWATDMKDRKEITSFEKEIQICDYRKLEKALESMKECLQQNELHEDTTVISTCDCISDCIDGESSEFDSGITLLRDEQGKTFDYFSDHSYSANMSRMLDTTVDKKGKEVTNVGDEMKTDGHENSKIVVKSKHLQQQIEYETCITEVSRVECVGDCTEDQMSTRANKLILLIPNEEESKHSICPYQDRAKTCMIENTDDLVAFTPPLTRDAVVPCLNDLSYSQYANSKPTSSNCSDRFPPVPSAFSLYDRMPEGFDTFEKIQLSPDDDDSYDAGLNNHLFLTSLPGQLLKTPQRHISHSIPGTKSKGHDQLLEEENKGRREVERFECHTAYMSDGFSNSDTICKELPYISAADVIAINWPEQQSNCESICEPIRGDLNTQSKSSTGSTESDRPASDISSYPEFEMKKNFDMVLKELSLFFDMSVSDFASNRASSPEQCHDITQPLEADLRKKHLSSTDLGCQRNTVTDEDCSLEACKGDPVDSSIAGSCDGEQEVPLSSNSCPETSMYTAEKHGEPRELEQKRKTWSPSFMCLPLLEQPSCSEFHAVMAKNAQRLKIQKTVLH